MLQECFWILEILCLPDLRFEDLKMGVGCINYGHGYQRLPAITGYFYGILHSINGVLLVLITDKWP